MAWSTRGWSCLSHRKLLEEHASSLAELDVATGLFKDRFGIDPVFFFSAAVAGFRSGSLFDKRSNAIELSSRYSSGRD